MIPASHPLSAASHKVVCVIKYCHALFYQPVIIPERRNSGKPSKEEEQEEKEKEEEKEKKKKENY